MASILGLYILLLKLSSVLFTRVQFELINTRVTTLIDLYVVLQVIGLGLSTVT